MYNVLILEASLEGKPFFSRSVETLASAAGEEMFPEIFEITSCNQLKEYEELNDFIIAITSSMMESIDPFDLLVITAASENNVLRWSLQIQVNGTELSVNTIDWKDGQHVYRHDGV